MRNNQNPPQEVIEQLKILLNNKKFSDTEAQVKSLTEKFSKSFILWNIYGVSLYGLKKFEKAIKSYQKAISINPKYIHAYINLGITLRAQGKLNAAVNICKKALLIEPKNALTFNNLGAIFTEQGKFNEAIKAYKNAILIQPNYAEVTNNLGVLLKGQGKNNEAIKAYKKAISIQEDYADAYNNLGAVLRDQGELNDAVEALKRAILLQPDNVEAYNNLGIVLRDQGKFNKAIQACTKALSLRPDYVDAYNNLGNVLVDLDKLDEAVDTYNKALAIQSDYAEANYNLSFLYNLKGYLQKGFELYEWRQRKNKPLTITPRDHLIWDGKETVLKKKFFVYEEQGLGDTIQFIRYLLLLKQKGAEVIFKVKPKMHALLKTLDQDIIFVSRDPDDNIIDFEAPLMSLPYLFNTNLNTIPSFTSYLSANHDKIILWRKCLKKDSFKIGICWQGSKSKVDLGRSFPLTLFEDISKLPNIELISLHKGEGEKQIKDVNFKLTVLGDDFDNVEEAFVDTAAVMLNCDLIISSDTAVAHLAGALGCRTWIVLKKIPDWRWMLDRNDSPWYTNLRLYRQKEHDNWKEIFETMKKDLQSLII